MIPISIHFCERDILPFRLTLFRCQQSTIKYRRIDRLLHCEEWCRRICTQLKIGRSYDLNGMICQEKTDGIGWPTSRTSSEIVCFNFSRAPHVWRLVSLAINGGPLFAFPSATDHKQPQQIDGMQTLKAIRFSSEMDDDRALQRKFHAPIIGSEILCNCLKMHHFRSLDTTKWKSSFRSLLLMPRMHVLSTNVCMIRRFHWPPKPWNWYSCFCFGFFFPDIITFISFLRFLHTFQMFCICRMLEIFVHICGMTSSETV